MSIYWLGSLLSQQTFLVGGKSAQLGRLARRYPVPPGFCLPAQAGGSARLNSAQAQAIRQAYQTLSAACGQPHLPVAVRSSAVDEDGQSASFAGMHESYLNICGETALLAAIERCLESASGERALAYRRSHGLPAQARLAVLVQQFIHADVSCVVFSADPVSGSQAQVLVNAVWGLGESLVGGDVTPDLYRLDKTSFTLLSQQLALKSKLSLPAAEGTRLVNVPRSLQAEAALQPEQLRLLAALACDLESRQGWPVDLECSFAKEQLYLLQCRPITTLAKPTLTPPSIWAKLSPERGVKYASIDGHWFSRQRRPQSRARSQPGHSAG